MYFWITGLALFELLFDLIAYTFPARSRYPPAMVIALDSSAMSILYIYMYFLSSPLIFCIESGEPHMNKNRAGGHTSQCEIEKIL